MELYKTKDIYEASVLLAKKIHLLHLERESKFFWFVFGEKKRCEQITNSYWNNNLQIRAKDYSDAIRSLKDRVFSTK